MFSGNGTAKPREMTGTEFEYRRIRCQRLGDFVVTVNRASYSKFSAALGNEEDIAMVPTCQL